ncbi:MAG: hypothetical protein QM638_10095 [Nocardioides sp.]|uniref:hypothetical protein n=1 Tax=Nocardioides sp. TaxID=35761 RepID=UPI0039E69DE4
MLVAPHRQAIAAPFGVDVTPNQPDGDLEIGMKEAHHDHSQTTSSDSTNSTTGTRPADGRWVEAIECIGSAYAECARRSHCDDGSVAIGWGYWLSNDSSRSNYGQICGSTLSTGQRIELTRDSIESAFFRIPLPEAPLKVQPPGGLTLVNFDTIFYTVREPFDRSVRLLGHRIDFHIRPSRFHWYFDDGDDTTTTTPGEPYSGQARLSRDITHRYLTKDTFHPHLDVTYAASYSIDGRARRPVDGTVTIQGSPHDLTTLTASPHLEG